MRRSQARVATPNGAKYLTQLCKHWSHKLDVELAGDHGVVRFPSATARFEAGPEALLVTLEAEEAELERMQDVIATHLDRFAFREAPLSFGWRDAA